MSRAGLIQVSSTIWAVTLSLLIADRATIPHLKGDNEGFHMRYSSMIWYKRLQSDRQIIRLAKSALVLMITYMPRIVNIYIGMY